MRVVRSLSAVALLGAILSPLTGCPDGEEPAPASRTGAVELRSDGEVLEVARVLNQSIMETTLAVRSKLDDAGAQLLADDMLQEHRAARERAMVLAERLQVDLQATPLSMQLERDAEARLARYLEKYGGVLERDWLEGQLALHDEALGVIDRQLLPTATAPEVRELLQDMRRIVTAHATRVEEVLGQQGRG